MDKLGSLDDHINSDIDTIVEEVNFDLKYEMPDIFSNAHFTSLSEGATEPEMAQAKELVEGTKTIIESIVKTVLDESVQSIEAQAKDAMKTSLVEIKSNLTEQVNEYLEYVVDKWLEENKSTVDNSIKIGMNESFMEGLKKLFVEHYVSIPDNKVDIVESLASNVEKLESDIKSISKEKDGLMEEINSLKKKGIFESLASDLSITQQEKLSVLVEDIKFKDEKSFASKVKTLKEFYFSEQKGKDMNQLSEPTNNSLNEKVVEKVINKESSDADLIAAAISYLRK